MKRISVALTYLMTVAVAAGAVVYMTGAAQAQTASTGGTKVAIVNVGLVFSKYDKARFYKGEMEAALKPFKDKGEAIKAEMVKYAEYLKTQGAKLTPKDREPYEKYLTAKKRELEDLDMEARKQIGKKQEDQIVTLYKELAGAVQAYSQANGIHLVLGYGEQIEGDLYSILNIQRKMNGMDLGSTTPLFLGLGTDISEAIINTLNQHYRAASGGTVPATPTSNKK